MSSPAFADELVVHHHDDTVTRYAGVRYWPWKDGVTVYDPDGVEIASHADVLEVFGSKAAAN